MSFGERSSEQIDEAGIRDAHANDGVVADGIGVGRVGQAAEAGQTEGRLRAICAGTLGTGYASPRRREEAHAEDDRAGLW